MSVIESKESKLTALPLQSLAQGSMFWQPDHIEPSDWLDHLPWVFWLIETLQPKRCVTLGARSGSLHLALCQGVKRIDSEAECLLVSKQSEALEISAQAERRYAACHRLVSASPLRAAKRVEPGIDIVVLDLPSDDEDMDIALEPWLGLMSAQGVVLIPGINGSDTSKGFHAVYTELQNRYPSLSFHHGEGMGMILIGATPPTLLETLLERWKTPGVARTVRDVFARLGRGIADQALGDQHKVQLGHTKERLKEVTHERDIQMGRVNELQHALEQKEHDASALENENRDIEEQLTDAQKQVYGLGEELSHIHLQLAEAQAALSSSQSEKQALQTELSEKDANISTRFNELAILTNMVEEADKKSERWERKAAQYFDLNAQKKAEAKQLRRQIVKADAKINDQRQLIDRLREAVNPAQVSTVKPSALEERFQKQSHSLDARFKELGELTAAMEQKEAELQALKVKYGEVDARESLPNGIDSKTSKRLSKKAQQRKLQTAIAELEASEWFDGKWYLQQYPDIASDEKYQRSPALHYLKFGGFEGRDPSPRFDSAGYLSAYPDVVAADINPLLHFIRDGIKEERQPKPKEGLTYNDDD